MTSKRTYLSREGHEKLTNELEELKGPRRREIAKALEKARALGDLKENAEYHAAKDDQAHLERQISDLEDKLAGAQIINKDQISSDKVTIATTVKLKDLDSGEKIEYALVSADEADPLAGKISVSSPIGQALIGHKVKDKVKIKIPAGTLSYQIVSIDA